MTCDRNSSVNLGLLQPRWEGGEMTVCLHSALTLHILDPFQTHNGFCFPWKTALCRLMLPLYLPPPAALIMWLLHDCRSRRYWPRLPPSLPLATLSPPPALSPLRLSGLPSGRMSAIDSYEQHFSSDAGLWLVPNRIQQTRDRVTDRLTST